LIAKNVKEHDDPKYRTLKASNSMLKNKVLNLKGGHEYLIAVSFARFCSTRDVALIACLCWSPHAYAALIEIQLGFRTQTLEFSQFYVFTATLKTSFELRVGSEVLEEHVSYARSLSYPGSLRAAV
jgi:hypothetical protein